MELFLVLFAIRYLLAPKYSTKPNYVKLREEVSRVITEKWIERQKNARFQGREHLLMCVVWKMFRRSMNWLRNGLRSLW